MTKPEDISQEDWDKAFYWMDDGGFIAAFYSEDDEDALQRTIAKAIMAAKAEERQNCISVVLSFIKYGGDTHHGITINGKVEAMEIAAAIRNRDTV